MAQLDRFLSLITHNRAAAVVLREGETALLETPEGTRAVTQAPLTGKQIVALVSEIAPAEAAALLRAGNPAEFEYSMNGAVFYARAERGAGGWGASIRATTAPAASAPNADKPAAAAGGGAASPALDALLRNLVSSGSSDLHLRCDEPPVLRLHGEMQRVEDQAVLEDGPLREMLFSIMPDRNRREFDELNDTDFAYEIAGISRFRVNVMLERKGVAAVFRAIPSQVVAVEQMGITPEVQKLCFLSKGLVLVTGRRARKIHDTLRSC